MEKITLILVALVAVEHIYIMVLEMFLWTKPRTLNVFGFSKEEAERTTVLAANQGVYNGFLAAGLVWGLCYPDAVIGGQIQAFFLSCVFTAALYGGTTVNKKIYIMQGLPALLALLLVIINIT